MKNSLSLSSNMNEPLLTTRVGYSLSLSSKHASDLARDIFRVLRVMPGIRMPLSVIAPVNLSTPWWRRRPCCKPRQSVENWIDATPVEPCDIDVVHITVTSPLRPDACFAFRIRFFGTLVLSHERVVAEWCSVGPGLEGNVVTQWESYVDWQTEACPTRLN